MILDKGIFKRCNLIRVNLLGHKLGSFLHYLFEHIFNNIVFNSFHKALLDNLLAHFLQKTHISYYFIDDLKLSSVLDLLLDGFLGNFLKYFGHHGVCFVEEEVLHGIAQVEPEGKGGPARVDSCLVYGILGDGLKFLLYNPPDDDIVEVLLYNPSLACLVLVVPSESYCLYYQRTALSVHDVGHYDVEKGLSYQIVCQLHWVNLPSNYETADQGLHLPEPGKAQFLYSLLQVERLGSRQFQRLVEGRGVVVGLVPRGSKLSDRRLGDRVVGHRRLTGQGQQRPVVRVFSFHLQYWGILLKFKQGTSIVNYFQIHHTILTDISFSSFSEQNSSSQCCWQKCSICFALSSSLLGLGPRSISIAFSSSFLLEFVPREFKSFFGKSWSMTESILVWQEPRTSLVQCQSLFSFRQASIVAQTTFLNSSQLLQSRSILLKSSMLMVFLIQSQQSRSALAYMMVKDLSHSFQKSFFSLLNLAQTLSIATSTPVQQLRSFSLFLKVLSLTALKLPFLKSTLVIPNLKRDLDWAIQHISWRRLDRYRALPPTIQMQLIFCCRHLKAMWSYMQLPMFQQQCQSWRLFQAQQNILVRSFTSPSLLSIFSRMFLSLTHIFQWMRFMTVSVHSNCLDSIFVVTFLLFYSTSCSHYFFTFTFLELSSLVTYLRKAMIMRSMAIPWTQWPRQFQTEVISNSQEWSDSLQALSKMVGNLILLELSTQISFKMSFLASVSSMWSMSSSYQFSSYSSIYCSSTYCMACLWQREGRDELDCSTLLPTLLMLLLLQSSSLIFLGQRWGFTSPREYLELQMAMMVGNPSKQMGSLLVVLRLLPEALERLVLEDLLEDLIWLLGLGAMVLVVRIWLGLLGRMLLENLLLKELLREWVMVDSPRDTLPFSATDSSFSLSQTLVLFLPLRISSLILHLLIIYANWQVLTFTASTPFSAPNSSSSSETASIVSTMLNTSHLQLFLWTPNSFRVLSVRGWQLTFRSLPSNSLPMQLGRRVLLLENMQGSQSQTMVLALAKMTSPFWLKSAFCYIFWQRQLKMGMYSGDIFPLNSSRLSLSTSTPTFCASMQYSMSQVFFSLMAPRTDEPSSSLLSPLYLLNSYYSYENLKQVQKALTLSQNSWQPWNLLSSEVTLKQQSTFLSISLRHSFIHLLLFEELNILWFVYMQSLNSLLAFFSLLEPAMGESPSIIPLIRQANWKQLPNSSLHFLWLPHSGWALASAMSLKAQCRQNFIKAVSFPKSLSSILGGDLFISTQSWVLAISAMGRDISAWMKNTSSTASNFLTVQEQALEMTLDISQDLRTMFQSRYWNLLYLLSSMYSPDMQILDSFPQPPCLVLFFLRNYCRIFWTWVRWQACRVFFMSCMAFLMVYSSSPSSFLHSRTTLSQRTFYRQMSMENMPYLLMKFLMTPGQLTTLTRGQYQKQRRMRRQQNSIFLSWNYILSPLLGLEKQLQTQRCSWRQRCSPMLMTQTGRSLERVLSRIYPRNILARMMEETLLRQKPSSLNCDRKPRNMYRSSSSRFMLSMLSIISLCPSSFLRSPSLILALIQSKFFLTESQLYWERQQWNRQLGSTSSMWIVSMGLYSRQQWDFEGIDFLIILFTFWFVNCSSSVMITSFSLQVFSYSNRRGHISRKSSQQYCYDFYWEQCKFTNRGSSPFFFSYSAIFSRRVRLAELIYVWVLPNLASQTDFPSLVSYTDLCFDSCIDF